MPAGDAIGALLDVGDLSVVLPTAEGAIPVVRRVSFQIRRGEAVGLVGESGSGKTMTALALLRLTPPEACLSGRVLFAGTDLTSLSARRLRRIRGRRIAMIFQEPMTALDPVYTVGFQIAEAVRAHRPVGRREARREAERLLDRVAVADAGRRLDDYPHQLSGGQRQRVMIAIALASGPDLLVADEPTSALDVTVQAQILALLEGLQRDLGLALLLITHDLGVVAQSCDRVLVLYAGQLVEEAPVDELFARPAHPYTRGLLAALPRLGRPAPRGQLPALPGRVPDPGALPSGCPFHPRCPEAMAACRLDRPGRHPVGAGHAARCFLYGGAEELG